MRSVDPDTGAAPQVVAHFDALVEARAGLEVTVRAAAVLAGCPAGLLDRGRRLRMRVLPDGRRADGEPTGVVVPLPAHHDGAVVWLERPSDVDRARSELDGVLVERFAAAIAVALDRTRAGSPAVDPAAVELLLDQTADENTRATAARRLGLAEDARFAVTVGIGAAAGPRSLTARIGDFDVVVEPAYQAREPFGKCSATGPAVGPLDLPRSYQQARTALRFTAEDEPGPTHLDVDALGGVLALAEGCDSPAAVAETALLDRVVPTYPWALATLTAVVTEPSLRSAAVALHVHHSTLQNRAELLGQALGYPVAGPDGRMRLAVALALRRLRRNRW
ncbi:helix-turn-helix domain-containing protein [Umezawaea sp. Da 62-37]|uniref:helix-turn-helix domain-containing protein n=1 Tax=Umezawaea sp. Da 62-37 TaxID=3075927 RepID=UPI0028F73B75|nr:helix-turn-helix domain-containing protein [Umezawaea sp. Da 62-37]WNV92164.1 helix-turn-helix domain-containing protein [Umezawaea sp. Da 62-37]